MKKIIMTLVAMLAITTTAFAETEKEVSINTAETYNMEININALFYALGLNEDQKETVADFHTTFCMEMLIAGNANKDEKDTLVNHAVNKNLINMSYILTQEQYRKYVTILNTTLVNRGLK